MSEKSHGIGLRQVRYIRKGAISFGVRQVGSKTGHPSRKTAPESADPFVSIIVQRPTPGPGGQWRTTTVAMFQLDLVEIQIEY